MTPVAIGQIGDALISLAGGTFATLYGFRKIGKPPGKDPAYDEKFRKVEKILKVCGPLVILYGIFELSRAFF